MEDPRSGRPHLGDPLPTGEIVLKLFSTRMWSLGIMNYESVFSGLVDVYLEVSRCSIV
jgi:hypothetical protein